MHQPNPEGVQLHEMSTSDELPNDMLEHPDWYTGYTDPEFLRETLSSLRKAQGNPDAMVRIYRSVPPEVASRGADAVFESGNWVSLSEAYAKQHGLDPEDPTKDWPYLSIEVPARDIRFAGDDLMEYGYWPTSVKASGVLEFKFNPAQPRDSRGRWTDTGWSVEPPEGFDVSKLSSIDAQIYRTMQDDPVESVRNSPYYKSLSALREMSSTPEVIDQELQQIEESAIEQRRAGLENFYKVWGDAQVVRKSVKSDPDADYTDILFDRSDVTDAEIEALYAGKTNPPTVVGMEESAPLKSDDWPMISEGDMTDGSYMDRVSRASEALLKIPVSDTSGRSYALYGEGGGQFDSTQVVEAADMLHGLASKHTLKPITNDAESEDWGGYGKMNESLVRGMTLPSSSGFLTPGSSVDIGTSFWIPNDGESSMRAVLSGWGTVHSGEDLVSVALVTEGKSRVYQITGTDEVITAGRFKVKSVERPTEERSHYVVTVEQTAMLDPAILTDDRFEIDSIKASGELEFRFNPSQPRDERGRWTDTGGSARAEQEALKPDYFDKISTRKFPKGVTEIGLARLDEKTMEWGYPDTDTEERILKMAETLAGKTNRLHVSIPSLVVDSVIKDGRLKNQYESGNSNGMYDPRARREAEDMMFGSRGASDRERPIYGTIGRLADVGQYGGFSVRLRPEVAARTTMTFGDSLLISDNWTNWPIPLSELGTASADRLFKAGSDMYMFKEIQVHGGVDLKRDVTDVVLNTPRMSGHADVGAALKLAKHLGLKRVLVNVENVEAEKSGERWFSQSEVEAFMQDIHDTRARGGWKGYEDITFELDLTPEERSRAYGVVAAVTELEFYSDSQPRDERGRWTETGAGDGRKPAYFDKIADHEFPYPMAQIGMVRADGSIRPSFMVTEGKIRDDVKMTAQSISADSIAVNVHYSVVDQILANGRLKTQFETESSGGYYDPDARRDAENLMFGDQIQKIADEERPIYGSVDVPTQENESMVYGGIKLRLKPEVADRTTVVFGDSLSHEPTVSVLPLPLKDAGKADVDRLLKAATDVPGPYVEAQIHGGVSVEDIASVMIEDGNETRAFSYVPPYPEDVQAAIRVAKAIGSKTIYVESDTTLQKLLDDQKMSSYYRDVEFVLDPRAVVASLVELACHTAECAPPPVGTGGSSPSGSGRMAWSTELKARDERLFSIDDNDHNWGWTEEERKILSHLADATPRTAPEGLYSYHLFKEDFEDPDFKELAVTIRNSREAVSRALADENPDPAIILVMQKYHQRLLDAFPEGADRLKLQRSTNDDDPFVSERDRFSSDGVMYAPQVTSWTAHPETPDNSVSWGTNSHVRGVDKHQILMSGGILDFEVLVTKDRRIVDALMAYPAKQLNGVDVLPIATYADRADASVVASLIELACHSPECAPPPVGKGGSLPSSSGLDVELRDEVIDVLWSAFLSNYGSKTADELSETQTAEFRGKWAEVLSDYGTETKAKVEARFKKIEEEQAAQRAEDAVALKAYQKRLGTLPEAVKNHEIALNVDTYDDGQNVRHFVRMTNTGLSQFYGTVVNPDSIDVFDVDVEAVQKDFSRFVKDSTESLRRVARNSDVFIQVNNEEALRSILTSGEMKSSFDPDAYEHSISARSGGGSLTNRATYEEKMFGIPARSGNVARPIYGYLYDKGSHGILTPEDGSYSIGDPRATILGGYGGISVQLKGVRNRTTFTAGDSMSQWDFAVPTPLTNPGAEGIGAVDVRGLSKPSTGTRGAQRMYGFEDDDWRPEYYEAQIHGGVTLNDIASVHFDYPPEPDTIRALRAANVPWTFEYGTASDERAVGLVATIELACHSPECAPPPVGTGGSLPEGGASVRAVGEDKSHELWTELHRTDELGPIDTKIQGSVDLAKRMENDPKFRAIVDKLATTYAEDVLFDSQYKLLAESDWQTSVHIKELTLEEKLVAGWVGQGASGTIDGTGGLIRSGEWPEDYIAWASEKTGLDRYEMVARAMAERLQNSWMHWSGGSDDLLSYAVQDAAMRRWGGHPAPYLKGVLDGLQFNRERIGPPGYYDDKLAEQKAHLNDPVVLEMADYLVDAKYRQVQDQLRSVGIGPNDEVSVYRGMHVGRSNEGTTGVIQPGASGEVTQNPLSSWTMSLDTARLFSGGIIMRQPVRAEEIFSISSLGMGALREYEVIVIGGNDPHYVDTFDTYDRRSDNPTVWPEYMSGLEYGATGTLEFGFDPNQPRDERGRWTSTGASNISFRDFVGAYDQHAWGADSDEYFQKYRQAEASHIHEVASNLARSPEFVKLAEELIADDPAEFGSFFHTHTWMYSEPRGLDDAASEYARRASADDDPDITWNEIDAAGREGFSGLARSLNLSEPELLGRMVAARMQWAWSRWQGGAMSGEDKDYNGYMLQKAVIQKVIPNEAPSGSPAVVNHDILYNSSYPKDPRIEKIVGMYAQATYDRTQSRLRSAGFGPDDLVDIYRGMTVPASRKAEFDSTTSLFQNPLSSWAQSERDARMFAFEEFAYRGPIDLQGRPTTKRAGILYRAQVPTKSIFSVGSLGLGDLGVSEVIVADNVLDNVKSIPE